jgi:hypothetical protein
LVSFLLPLLILVPQGFLMGVYRGSGQILH